MKGLLQASHRLAAGYVMDLKRINGPDGPWYGDADGGEYSGRWGTSGFAKQNTCAPCTTSLRMKLKEFTTPGRWRQGRRHMQMGAVHGERITAP